MLAEIISIGDEILIGQTINTNAGFLASRLNATGIAVGRVSVVGDQAEQIREMLGEAGKRAGLVVVTGGLGPTRDDITKAVICDFFSTRLVFDETVLADNTAFFARRGLELTELNRRQAFVPESAAVIRNPFGTAPGLWMEKGSIIYLFMPGVPHEMKHMVDSTLLPRLKALAGGHHIVHKTLLTQGIGESFLADLIAGWEEALPSGLKLAYLPSPGIVKLRLSAAGPDEVMLHRQIDRAMEELRALIPQYVWGEDDQRLEEVIGQILRGKGMSLSTAESCTGGYIAHRITSVPGSSAWFRGSVVAYDNEVKTGLLGLSPALLQKHGAVSREVVECMAREVRLRLGTDASIAVSGIAGPDGGTPGKPVGTVWIAVAGAEGVRSKLFRFGDERERNIVRAAIAALGMLKNMLDPSDEKQDNLTQANKA